eukprot:scaffold82437_cov69-Cyclotella_meneghiniana.AAC.1
MATVTLSRNKRHYNWYKSYKKNLLVYPINAMWPLHATYPTITRSIPDYDNTNDFLQKSNNSSRGEVYSHGVASAVLVPDVTEENRMLDVYNTTYCARIDVYYDDESIYTDTFDLDITYRNYEVDGKYGIAASLNEDRGDGTATAWSVDGGQIGLGIM